MMATYEQMKEALEKDKASEYDGGRSAFIVERIRHIWRCLGEPSKKRLLCFKCYSSRVYYIHQTSCSQIFVVLSNETKTTVSELLLLQISLTHPMWPPQTQMQLSSLEFPYPYRYCSFLLQAILGLLVLSFLCPPGFSQSVPSQPP